MMIALMTLFVKPIVLAYRIRIEEIENCTAYQYMSVSM